MPTPLRHDQLTAIRRSLGRPDPVYKVPGVPHPGFLRERPQMLRAFGEQNPNLVQRLAHQLMADRRAKQQGLNRG